jgi:hypothetical protein
MDVVSSTISAIQLAISLAQEVAPIVKAGKDWIAALFEGGVIDKATQDAAHAHIDAWATAHEAGTEKPSWTVEPDPIS